MSDNSEKCIAIVGRPNVGKSRLFNRLLSRRVSIVHDMPGVTRDIVAEPLGEGIVIMDTGGMFASESMAGKVIIEATNAQAEFAIVAADLIIFVVDSQDGLTPLDERIADLLRSSGKDILLAVNKVDVPNHEDKISEFYALGFKDIIGVSAEHGLGAEKLRLLIEKRFGAIKEVKNLREEGRIYLSVAGRPNVGKSSLGNRLLGAEKLIVSDIAGTTRDSIWHDIDFKLDTSEDVHKFRLFDTAGLRVKRKINTSLDFLSSMRTKQAIGNSDIVLLVLDAMEGVSELDKRLCGEILAEGASIMIVVNKWDYAVKAFNKEPLRGYENIEQFKKSFEEAVRKQLFFIGESPIYFVSALENRGLKTLLVGVSKLYQKMMKPLQTSKVNAAISQLLLDNPPKYVGGKRFKVYYAVRTSSRPMTFRLYCNRSDVITKTYERYLENGLREKFKLGGIALKLEMVGKAPQTLQERLGKK